MFTGVIEEIGTVRHIAQVASGMRLGWRRRTR